MIRGSLSPKMTDSPNTAAVLLHDQMLEMEGESTTFAKSPYFNIAQKTRSDAFTGSQNFNER